MDGSRRAAGGGPFLWAAAGRSRLRRATLILLTSAALVAAGWRAGPRVGAMVRLHLAERDLAAGRLDEAEARLLLLIAERPERTHPRLLLVQVARRRGRITEAEEVLQRAVELGLSIEDGRREHVLLAAGHDFPGAEPSLRRMLKDHPGDSEVRRALTEGYARADRGREAALLGHARASRGAGWKGR